MEASKELAKEERIESDGSGARLLILGCFHFDTLAAAIVFHTFSFLWSYVQDEDHCV